MKAIPRILLLGSLLSAAVMSAETVNFDDAPAGGLPPNWRGTQTGEGAARWSVESDDTAPTKAQVLKQSGRATYPVCLKTDTRLQDGFVEVKFKPVAGEVDQAGGVVWRARDADNYYVARANALENNVTIYHTIGGRRVSFKTVDTKVAGGVWHTLRVDFTGNRFVVTFDGRKVIEAADSRLRGPGMVGVWTKADSVTLFDDFSCGGP